jgi:NAD(P)-dependent dehydrogenase (short-subunit alcohol dehydrogenase family)
VRNRSVLVTGASSGIGKECAILLASHGFQVFAGVRKPEDALVLSSAVPGRMVPVMIDVTVPSSIEAAVNFVRAALPTDASFGLVNNAGITIAGPLEVIPIDSVRQQFEVNVIGQVAVTQAFLPLLRAACGGRIVILGSVLGKISPPLVAPYAAAKFALEAIADSLAVELRPWDIRVSLLEPGNIATPIWQTSKRRVLAVLDSLDAERQQLYASSRSTIERLANAYSKRGIPAERVARAVMKALTVPRPHARYRVGLDSKILGAFSPIVPYGIRYWITRRVLSLR